MKTIRVRGRLLDLSQPVVMGIVNITPDSFHADSRKQTEGDILGHIRRMIAEGADIIDIGAQSSNPQSPLLSIGEEKERLQRILPAISKEFPDTLFSIDTFYADIARMCVEEYGVAIVNDISGGQLDERMFATVADLHVPYILMHMKGSPQTMTQHTQYADLLGDILYYFSEKVATLSEMGVSDIVIDPGFGFSKTPDQNYELMAHLKNFHIFDLPLLVGISRKSMIYKLLNQTPAESLNGTTALNMYSLLNGAHILRVHDVKEAADCVQIYKQLSHFGENHK